MLIRPVGLQNRMMWGLNTQVKKCTTRTFTPFAAFSFQQLSQQRHLSLKPNFQKLKLIPQAPGGVQGQLNEPLKKAETNYFEGSFHWDYERIVAISLLPSVMFPMYCALSSGTAIYPVADAILGSLLLIHCNYGFQSCIIDYIPKRKFGFWHSFAKGMLRLGCVMGLYGIYEIETNNNGLCDLVGKLWKDPESGLYLFGK